MLKPNKIKKYKLIILIKRIIMLESFFSGIFRVGQLLYQLLIFFLMF